VRLNFTDPKSIIFLLNFLHLIFSSVQFSSTVLLKEILNRNSTVMMLLMVERFVAVCSVT